MVSTFRLNLLFNLLTIPICQQFSLKFIRPLFMLTRTLEEREPFLPRQLTLFINLFHQNQISHLSKVNFSEIVYPFVIDLLDLLGQFKNMVDTPSDDFAVINIEDLSYSGFPADDKQDAVEPLICVQRYLSLKIEKLLFGELSQLRCSDAQHLRDLVFLLLHCPLNVLLPLQFFPLHHETIIKFSQKSTQPYKIVPILLQPP